VFLSGLLGEVLLFVGGHSLSLRSSVAHMPPQPLVEKGRSQDVPLWGKLVFSA